MIRQDWRIARAALQVLAEERHGSLVRQLRAEEDEAMRAAQRALSGRRR